MLSKRLREILAESKKEALVLNQTAVCSQHLLTGKERHASRVPFTHSWMFVCVTFSCLFLFWFFYSTAVIQMMPSLIFPDFYFSSQPAKAHTASMPPDVSDLHKLFLRFRLKKETPVCTFFVVFSCLCHGPVRQGYFALCKLSFLLHICGKTFFRSSLIGCFPSCPKAHIYYCSADASSSLLIWWRGVVIEHNATFTQENIPIKLCSWVIHET